MTDVLLTCQACENEIEVAMDRAVLRVDVEPVARAELLFLCPACQAPTVKTIRGELLTLLLLVGVRPVALAEPTLDAADQAPIGPRFTRDDLLRWHEQLENITWVTPWE